MYEVLSDVFCLKSDSDPCDMPHLIVNEADLMFNLSVHTEFCYSNSCETILGADLLFQIFQASSVMYYD